MTETITFHREGHLAQLTLNHAQRHNSLGREQIEAIESHLHTIESDSDVRVLLLTGAGEKTFCAGAALHELSAGGMRDDAFQRMTARLAALSIPSVCALNGNVFGGGVELAASCDFRIGVEGIRMRVPAASLGLCYPLEGIKRFVEAVGVPVARRILVASETFQTADMVQIGFLDKVVSANELAEVSTQVALHIAGLAPLAVQSMNAILDQINNGTLDEAAAAERVAIASSSEDLQEGFAAQREKRAPVFKGK